MNKNILMLAIAGVAIAAFIASTRHYTEQIDEPKPLRKLNYVQPVDRDTLKNRGSSLPCSEERLYSLRLMHNGKLLWQKTHEEVFSMQGIKNIESRKLRGEKRVLPVIELLQDNENVSHIDFVDCGNNSLIVNVNKIKQMPDAYLLGLNNKGWIKLMKFEDERFRTHAKAIVDINMRDNKN